MRLWTEKGTDLGLIDGLLMIIIILILGNKLITNNFGYLEYFMGVVGILHCSFILYYIKNYDIRGEM